MRTMLRFLIVLCLLCNVSSLGWAKKKKKKKKIESKKPKVEETIKAPEPVEAVDGVEGVQATEKAVAADIRVGLTETFDDIAGWNTNGAEGTEHSVVKKGDVMLLKYDLKDTGQWLQVEKDYSFMLPERYRFLIKTKASGSVNRMEMKLEDTDGTNFGFKTALDVTNEWDEIELTNEDITYWWGDDKELGPIRKILFAICSMDGGAGEVYFDDIIITEGDESLAVIESGLIDDFEDPKGWRVSNDKKCSLSLKKGAAGKEGKGLGLKYSFAEEGGWVQVSKRVRIKISEESVLRFWAKFTGDENRLEFKLVDADGSTFGIKFEELNGGWEEIEFAIDELEYWWGGDEDLDEPKEVFFAVGPIDGGKGSLYIDEFYLEK